MLVAQSHVLLREVSSGRSLRSVVTCTAAIHYSCRARTCCRMMAGRVHSHDSISSGGVELLVLLWSVVIRRIGVCHRTSRQSLLTCHSLMVRWHHTASHTTPSTRCCVTPRAAIACHHRTPSINAHLLLDLLWVLLLLLPHRNSVVAGLWLSTAELMVHSWNVHIGSRVALSLLCRVHLWTGVRLHATVIRLRLYSSSCSNSCRCIDSVGHALHFCHRIHSDLVVLLLLLLLSTHSTHHWLVMTRRTQSRHRGHLRHWMLLLMAHHCVPPNTTTTSVSSVASHRMH